MSEWKSEQLQRYAAEAKWDREDYDRMVSEWYGAQKPLRGDGVPQRALVSHADRRSRMKRRG